MAVLANSASEGGRANEPVIARAPHYFTNALRDAGLTALIAFGLFLPLVGLKTVQNINEVLVLTTRWPLLFALAAIVGVGRLAYVLTVPPWLERRAARPIAPGWPRRTD